MNIQKIKSITYSQVGDNYETKDPIKKLAQSAAVKTGINIKKHGFEEVSDSRGESAFVWSFGKAQDKNSVLMASVIEGLGTKNLMADAMRKVTGKSYYNIVAHDTVASIINDLVTVGAQPLVIQAYWAIENNDWLQDDKRMKDFIAGWKEACDLSGVTWGGGETPTLKGIIEPNTIDVAGSAVGVIKSEKRLLTDKKLQVGDRIVFLKSSGINANGLSLARAVASKLPKGYAGKLPDGTMYGEALLTKTNIYATLIQNLLDANIDIHYISNVTGHGLRKVMRARHNFTYVIENIFEPQEIFLFIKKHANLDDYEMYQTYNMGMDYAIFLPKIHVEKTKSIIKKCGFGSIDAGYVKKGERQVVIQPKGITYKGETLSIR